MATMKTKLVLVGAATALLVMYTDVFNVSYSIASELEQKQRVLSLDAADIEQLIAETGAGMLIIKGDESTDKITVNADVFAEDDNEVTLSLVKSGSQAKLIAQVEQHSNWSGSDSPRIDVTLTLPKNLKMDITDGSGSIDIQGMNTDITLTDGSGSITLDGAGQLNIKDGSGSIHASNVQGNVSIQDGSGSIELTDVDGNVDIKDGSGSMTVQRVSGLVSIDDGSGSINVDYAKGLTIHRAGSGAVNYQHIEGEVNL